VSIIQPMTLGVRVSPRDVYAACMGITLPKDKGYGELLPELAHSASLNHQTNASKLYF